LVIFRPFLTLLLIVCTVALPFPLTFSGLAKVAISTTNVDAENQTLINHKCVCGALNRHFCQTRVMPSFFFSVCGQRCQVCTNVWRVTVRLLALSFAFLGLVYELAKKQM
jgi:hypothetical protein